MLDKEARCILRNPSSPKPFPKMLGKVQLLFPSDNDLSFPNLKKSEIGPSRWLSPRNNSSMLVRFHRGLGIEPERLQEAILNVMLAELDDQMIQILPAAFTLMRFNFIKCNRYSIRCGKPNKGMGLDDISRDSKLERWKTPSGNIPYICVVESSRFVK
ncbi:hypothetical protein H5410_000553 [Solanum commersonii]|uniref:Uncharacterized protein n=1 Tax=Solanum commersonii TaxID=4109 RepID=A0A9J6AWJ5_SOLCO|nr:hypothetical protein H5410_000553 [Solanum commersonii]